ncbi:MAG: hypothetical protein KDA81_11575 [Planctomycetaceae bacterium]|nr:hypothetical protein [Planctomycetaceae bacterium]MCA9084691.1 hypothetical protein [Planctomycetaceae bacterium]
MNLFLLLADISPLPFVLVGGTLLLIAGGVIMAIAVLSFGYVKRRRDQRRRSESSDTNDRLTEAPDRQN